MIPQKHGGGVEIDGLTGERNEFSIAANGKAFRILIDGLYSNKVRAVVRELWSNAHDSHIAAGTPERPFKSDIPTTMDPTFRVRDYGVGMSHQSIMERYTTMFDSTKDDTNEATGMLGLGSKSPFAYTDTFSVIAYDGQSKRIYVANIGANGIPAITYLSNEPCVEEQGIEISFPVNRHDINNFISEAKFVSIGFKIKPEVSGVTLSMPEPRLSGKNWAIYPYGAFGHAVTSPNLIRQGSACYPSSDITVRGLASSWITLIDVPIGTCDVAASRDLLSYTPETRKRVEEIVSKIGQEIVQDIEAVVAKATTRRQKAEVYAQFNGVMSNLRGSTFVSLLHNPRQLSVVHDTVDRRPGDVVFIGREFTKKGTRSRYNQKAKSSEEVHLLDCVRLFVDYGTPMVRKMSRIKTHCSKYNDFIVTAEVDNLGREVAASWVAECWELKSHQIIRLDSIPDPGPVRGANGQSPVKKVLATGQYWMLRKGNTCETVYGFGVPSNHQGWPPTLATAQGHLNQCKLSDIVRNDILYVTTLQAKKLGLPDTRRFDLCVEEELKRQANKLPIDEALSVIELNTNVNGHPYEVVREQFFSHLTMTPAAAYKVIEKAKYANINLQTRTITASVRDKVRLLAATYPLLFGKTDKSVFEEYIKQVQASTKEVQPA